MKKKQKKKKKKKIEKKKTIIKWAPFASWPSVMINPQWLELPISGTNFHGPKDVRAIEVRLYLHYLKLCLQNAGFMANSTDPDQVPIIMHFMGFRWY